MFIGAHLDQRLARSGKSRMEVDLERAGHVAAVETIHRVERSAIGVIRISPGHEGRAKDIFIRYGDKSFSFTDCTSFAVEGISVVLTVDEHFRLYPFRHPVTILP